MVLFNDPNDILTLQDIFLQKGNTQAFIQSINVSDHIEVLRV